MEYRVVAGALGAFYAEGLDPKDTASISPHNTIYSSFTPVMQFTGLLDKNRVEIYEGDVVIERMPGSSTEYRGVVEWNKNSAAFMINEGTIYMKALLETTEKEVLGNIYENPELLK